MAQEGSLTKQRSDCLRALWRARHGHRSMSLAPVPRFLGSGRTAGHLVAPRAEAQSFAFCSACRRLRRVRSCWDQKVAAGLFLLVGGSLTRELELGSPAGAPDGAWVKAASGWGR